MSRYTSDGGTTLACDGTMHVGPRLTVVLEGPHYFLPTGWDTVPLLGELCPDCMADVFGEEYGR